MIDRRRLAVVALEVSIWACGRTVCKQKPSTTSPLGVGEPNMGAELGPFLAEPCAGGPIKGSALLLGAGQCHIGKGG